MKKIIAGTCAMLALASSMFAAPKKGTVRYLNFKPEVASIYQELAAEYEKETGVKVIVETAANNAYESTLATKMSTKQAPTLFQINGPRGYANWADYCADLSETELYKHLTDKSLAVTNKGKVYGIPYVVEGYGIIYNKAITDKYFALSTKNTPYKSMDEVNNFAKLKEVADDMQKNAAALGIKGAFASTSLKAGEDWRWQTHLANLPVYYEFKNNNVDLTSDATKAIKFQYSKEFQNIMDLYLNDSVIPAKNVGVKTVTDSMSEFALEECAFVQNGNWAWGQIAGTPGNKVKAENVKYLPIYTGVAGEEGQGLCVGTENFYCINKKASKADQKATADFIYWLYSSKIGKNYVTNKLGFIAPFDTFADNEKPTDPLAVEILNWMSKPGITSVSWNFTLFPSQTFKDNFGASLLKYAQGNKSWDDVTKDVVADWKRESDAAM
ncbi:MAG: ABC transporter substrate-binding protein [Treponema sp.]|nr:ABC transporter substrate-binding protein [Treponema sp.]MDY5124420.1 ABC transporter substrate-binding protein [Treponema sp.]